MLSLRFHQKRRRWPDHLMIACMPKSGSTYLHAILSEITGLRDACVSEFGHANEGDICERRLRRLRRRSLMQLHVKATETNLKWMIKYRVRPIVQTRSLFDVVVSLHDHFEREKTGLPCGFVGDEFWNRSWNDRLSYLIHIHLPWYFNFIRSWHAADEIEICPIAYEELFADQVGSLTRILDFYRICASRQQIAEAVARTAQRDTRLNVGISGRGNRCLTSEHKQAIHNLAALARIELSEVGSVVSAIPAARLAHDKHVLPGFAEAKLAQDHFRRAA